MKVSVEAFATLVQFLPAGSRGGHALIDVPEGSTVADVTRTLGVPADVSLVSLVNGRDAGLEYLLQAGDTLTLFPPLAGG